MEELFQPIQCTVAIFTSEQAVGIDVFYTYASQSHKFQKEFAQLERVHKEKC